jgi:hypothetical protein
MTAKAEALDDYDRVVGRTMPPITFNVTQVIGSVVLDGTGDMSGKEAAFQVIAKNADDGVFRFPMPDGNDCIVTVEFDYHAV